MRDALIVTGATSDIGFEYLKSLAGKDLKIIGIYNKCAKRLEELKLTYNLDIEQIQIDLLKTDQIASIMKDICLRFNVVKVLHLAALQVKQERFHKMSTDVFLTDYSIQVISIVEILKYVLPQMKKNRSGKVVFILSSYVLNNPPKFCSSYTTNKHALLGLMKSLVSEYGEYNIQINSISPSMVETKFLESLDSRLIESIALKHPLKRNLKADELSDKIEFLMGKSSDFINGINLNVTGGEIY